MAIMSYIQAVTTALREEMQRDEKVFVLGEDVGKKVAFSVQRMVCMKNLGLTVCLTHHLLNLLLLVLALVQQCMECVRLQKCSLPTLLCLR